MRTNVCIQVYENKNAYIFILVLMPPEDDHTSGRDMSVIAAL
jgi:hypothetical protein